MNRYTRWELPMFWAMTNRKPICTAPMTCLLRPWRLVLGLRITRHQMHRDRLSPGTLSENTTINTTPAWRCVGSAGDPVVLRGRSIYFPDWPPDVFMNFKFDSFHWQARLLATKCFTTLTRCLPLCWNESWRNRPNIITNGNWTDQAPIEDDIPKLCITPYIFHDGRGNYEVKEQ